MGAGRRLQTQLGLARAAAGELLSGGSRRERWLREQNGGMEGWRDGGMEEGGQPRQGRAG